MRPLNRQLAAIEPRLAASAIAILRCPLSEVSGLVLQFFSFLLVLFNNI